MKWFCILTALLVTAVPALQAADPTPKPKVGIEEKLGSYVPLDMTLTDEDGNPILLSDVVTKPTILTFVYFRCPGICTPLLTDLAKTVEKMDLQPGQDYQIVTVSFDHTETADVAAEKRDNYLGTMRRPFPASAWRFFTGDSTTIAKLTGSAGFYFVRDHEDWIHAGALILLSPEGKITRYINGTAFLPFDVKMAVLEASHGTVSPTIANVLKFCFSYDPAGHTYALNVTRISLALILVLAAVFAVVFLILPRMKKSERQLKYGKTV